MIVDDDDVLRHDGPLEVSELACADWYTWSNGWRHWGDVRFRWRIVIMEVMLQSRGLSRKIRRHFGVLWRKVLWKRAPHRFLKLAYHDDGPVHYMGNELLGCGALVNTSLRDI